MDKKEGGESQLDVGGKYGHRLSPIQYTLIADIKGFRLKLEKTFSAPEKSSKEYDIKSRTGPAPIHSALIDGADHREVTA
jgi:hypothetical protein